MKEKWRLQSHPQASREVQILGLKNSGDLEQWKIETYVKVGDADSKFVIKFVDPQVTNKNLITGEILLKTKDSDLAKKINKALKRGNHVIVTSTITKIRNIGTDEQPELIEDMPFDS
jgi:hypothetical protein